MWGYMIPLALMQLASWSWVSIDRFTGGSFTAWENLFWIAYMVAAIPVCVFGIWAFILLIQFWRRLRVAAQLARRTGPADLP